MDFTFFTTNNKSGYKTNEKWLSKNFPILYGKIIKYAEDIPLNLSFKEKIWFYFNKLKERPKCITCGTEIKFRGRFDKPYGEFCSLGCINTNKEEMTRRQISTFQKKYSVDFFPNHKDFLPKQRKTKLERYGNENYNNIDKGRDTKFKRYGNRNFVNTEKYIKTCSEKYGTKNYSQSNNYRNKIIKNFKQLYPNINFVDIKKHSVTIKCEMCGKDFSITKQLLYERHKRGYIICTYCNPVGQANRSGLEEEVCKFLHDNGIKYETNKKIKDKRTEIDIFLTEYNIGIEINGVYWHNELHKEPNYHLDKTIHCSDDNISLIHIFEDEWLYHKDIVKSIILNKTGLTTYKIFARKCKIKEVDSKTAKNFLDDNHIQGNVNSKVRLGLFYGDKLVSLMSFSMGRMLMGGKNYEWELTRYCNLLNYSVTGAASKLLEHFVNQYNPNKIISYSDIRIFDGSMYEKLGFKRISQSKPNYWYVINGIRYHRFNFRKSILVKEGYDSNKTEKSIMFDRKIYRIYDCGHIRWELNLQKN